MMRRILNSHPKILWSEVKDLLVEYNKRMQRAGHSLAFRKEVIEKAMVKFCRLRKLEVDGVRRIHRSRAEREQYWKENGGRQTSSNWFRTVGFHTALGIPATEG